MSEHFEYIDAYFQQELSDAEKNEFEQKCVTDEEFAKDVALYISSRSALREMLLEQKKQEWSKLDSTERVSTQAPVRQMNTKRWILYAAAACVILAIIIFPFLSADSPQTLANKYVSQNLTSLSQTMDASSDSMQLGMAAYNKGDYATSLLIFQNYYQSHPDQNDALRYVGQTHLVTANFDKAISSFEELAQKNTFSNPGPFLKAVTLMKRNQGNDLQVAKGLLQKIVNENLDGKKEAEKWLKNWPD